MHQIQASQNPQAMLQNAIMQNPNLQKAAQMIRMSGASPQQLAALLAQQNNVNLDDLIRELQA